MCPTGLVGYFNIQSVAGSTALVNAGTLGSHGNTLILPGAAVPFDSQLSPDTAFAIWTGTSYQVLSNGNYRIRAAIQIQVNLGTQSAGSFLVANLAGNVPIGPAGPVLVAASNPTDSYPLTIILITISRLPMLP